MRDDDKRTFLVTFKDGKKMRVRAHDNVDAKRDAIKRRYRPGTLPDLIEKGRNVDKVESV